MGNIALNTNFYVGMKFELLGKNGIKFMIVDEDGNMKMIMIRVNVEQVSNAMDKLKLGVASIA